MEIFQRLWPLLALSLAYGADVKRQLGFADIGTYGIQGPTIELNGVPYTIVTFGHDGIDRVSDSGLGHIVARPTALAGGFGGFPAQSFSPTQGFSLHTAPTALIATPVLNLHPSIHNGLRFDQNWAQLDTLKSPVPVAQATPKSLVPLSESTYEVIPTVQNFAQDVFTTGFGKNVLVPAYDQGSFGVKDYAPGPTVKYNAPINDHGYKAPRITGEKLSFDAAQTKPSGFAQGFSPGAHNGHNLVLQATRAPHSHLVTPQPTQGASYKPSGYSNIGTSAPAKLSGYTSHNTNFLTTSQPSLKGIQHVHTTSFGSSGPGFGSTGHGSFGYQTARPYKVGQGPTLAPHGPTLAPHGPTLAPHGPTFAPQGPTPTPHGPTQATYSAIHASNDGASHYGQSQPSYGGHAHGYHSGHGHGHGQGLNQGSHYSGHGQSGHSTHGQGSHGGHGLHSGHGKGHGGHGKGSHAGQELTHGQGHHGNGESGHGSYAPSGPSHGQSYGQNGHSHHVSTNHNGHGGHNHEKATSFQSFVIHSYKPVPVYHKKIEYKHEAENKQDTSEGYNNEESQQQEEGNY